MNRLPEPTERELKAWRRLVAMAARAASNPAGPAGDLQDAANAARRCVVPGPPPTAVHAFIRLHRTALRFVHETRAGRAALAPELAEVCLECLAVLDGERPPARVRADLDG